MTFLPNFFDVNVHHSPSDQVQNGRTFVKNIVFERTFSAQNNAIPEITGVVNIMSMVNIGVRPQLKIALVAMLTFC